MEGPFFVEPNPLGLLADRYSHPVGKLGEGSFGKVYLCCLRTQVVPQLERSLQISDDARCMSIDLDASGKTEATAATQQPQAAPAPSPQHLRAYDHQWTAVKIFKPLAQYDLNTLEYLKREVLCQRRLNHEHVIGFREVGLTTDLRLYLALEYADSGTLKDWLSKYPGGRVPEDTARWFAQQLVYGLAYCHANGICNRDIKPDNLLLHSHLYAQGIKPLQLPLLKIADFGLCKSSLDSAPKTCVGSPHYMAPEVFSGKPYDGRKADVFSCGVVIYRMVFGDLPFTRTRDGRRLDFRRNFKEITDNMRNELWPSLLPMPASDAAATHPPPSAQLLDLLYGMLRYDPLKRMSLYDVKLHDWYKEGLTKDTYEMLLSEDAMGEQATAQSVELIEAEFGRIIEHFKSLKLEASRAMVGDGEDVALVN